MRRSYTIPIILIILMTAVAALMVGCSNDGDNVENNIVFTVQYLAEQGGYIEGKAEQRIKLGQDGSVVRAVALDGYVFYKWSDGETNAARMDSDLQADITVNAIFKKQRFILRYTSEVGGVLKGETVQVVEYGENADTVSVTPPEGYEFDKWSDGVTNATRTDSDVQADITVKAIFKRKRFILRYSIAKGGSLKGESVQGVSYGEDGTVVSVAPLEGYEFVGWSDGVTEKQRKDNNVQSDILVEAIFKKQVFIVKYDQFLDPKGGYVQGEAEQYVEYGGGSSVVKAIPNEGYYFYGWSDGYKTAERSDISVKMELHVQPYFFPIPLSVHYRPAEGGGLAGVYSPTIGYGGDVHTVRAVPHNGYVFIGWSDGVTTAERTDRNVTSDIDVTAYFGYSAEYLVNNGVGGKIIGEVYQTAMPGLDFSAVDAVPDAGYAFCGWSDLKVEAARHDTNAERCLEHIAYFQPITKTFEYDYGIAQGIPMESNVTIDRNNMRIYGYPTPQISGYTFEGWYADRDYKVKAINSDGRYMLGYYGFALGTDTLYARWKPIDQTRHIFKILLVFVNEVKAQLYPAIKNGDGLLHDVHHQMTAIDREYCELLHSLAIKYLGDWLSDLTDVEIDMYHTVVEPLTESDLYDYIGHGYYSLRSLPEAASLYTSYHSVLHIWGVNDYDSLLSNRSIVGAASMKFGNVFLEGFYYPSIIGHKRLQDELLRYKTIEKYNEVFVDTLIHEFIHTCECLYLDSEIMDFHKAISANRTHVDQSLSLLRLYLLGEIEYNGEIGGIPKDFWLNKCDRLLPFDLSYA